MILLLRRSLPGQFSIERLFSDVAANFGPDVRADVVHAPHQSRGVLRRIKNIVFAARLRADVIHVAGDIQYCAIGVRRRRCVLTVADLGSMRRLRGLRRAVFFLLWYRLPCAWATRVTTISPFIATELVAALPRVAAKISVIPCPVGQAFTRGLAETHERELSRVLQIGTAPNKNVDRLASALAGLDVELRIVGPLNDAQSLLVGQSGVRYTSVRDLSDDNLVSEYRTADVLTFVSTYEGFGLPIIEAQSVGLPVVTSRIEPTAWVAGDGALLVDPYDIDEIVRAVRRVLTDASTRSSLQRAGFANVRRFQPAHVAEAYAAVYRTLCETRAPRSGNIV